MITASTFFVTYTYKCYEPHLFLPTHRASLSLLFSNIF